MKLVFRTTQSKTVTPLSKLPSIFINNANNANNGNNNLLARLETHLSFSGSMIHRVQSSGAPCGSCGGR